VYDARFPLAEARPVLDMPWYIPLVIFFARICDVSIGTVRTMLLTQGVRGWAAVLGFLEVTIWVLAVGGVMQHLGNPLALLGYAGGFATGTLVGMHIEAWLALGYRMVRVINPDRTVSVSERLRERDFRVTMIQGQGLKGPVEIAFAVVQRRDLRSILKAVQEVAPAAFVTVERADHAAGSMFLRDGSANGRPEARQQMRK
jgi:uncharacterized protein YebE (UPF0316 family)